MQLYDGGNYLEITSGPRANKQDQKMLPPPSKFDDDKDYPQDTTIVYDPVDVPQAPLIIDRKVLDKDSISAIMNHTQGRVMSLSEQSEEKTELTNHLRKHIIGQDEPCEKLADAIDAGFYNPMRTTEPGAIIFEGGPTGVGKTLSAESLAEFFFGDKDALIRIQCEELQDSHSLSRLIGTHDGYVGFGMKKPFHDVGKHFSAAKKAGKLHPMLEGRENTSVILLDEVEKAHPSISQALLGAFSTGILKIPTKKTKDKSDTYQNEVIYLTDCIIIMTSNVGQSSIQANPMGFSMQNDAQENQQNSHAVTEAIKKHFSPEFIGRIQSFIHFNKLKKQHAKEIVHSYVQSRNAYLLDYYSQWNIQLSLSDELQDYIIERGFNETTGARSLKETIKDTAFRSLGRIMQNSEIKESLDRGEMNLIHLDINESNRVVPEVYSLPGEKKGSTDKKIFNRDDDTPGIDFMLKVCEQVTNNNTLNDKIDSLHYKNDKFFKKYRKKGLSRNQIYILKEIHHGDLLESMQNTYLAIANNDRAQYDNDNIFEIVNNDQSSTFIKPRFIKRFIDEKAAVLLGNSDKVTDELIVLRLILSSIEAITSLLYSHEEDFSQQDYLLSRKQQEVVMRYSMMSIYSMYDQ